MPAFVSGLDPTGKPTKAWGTKLDLYFRKSYWHLNIKKAHEFYNGRASFPRQYSSYICQVFTWHGTYFHFVPSVWRKKNLSHGTFEILFYRGIILHFIYLFFVITCEADWSISWSETKTTHRDKDPLSSFLTCVLLCVRIPVKDRSAFHEGY